jgi:hypothetical protein
MLHGSPALPLRVRCSLALTVSFAIVAGGVLAQTPHTLAVPQPLASRQVHPAIAPVTVAARHGTSPLFQYADQAWNHGEGFTTSGNDCGGTVVGAGSGPEVWAWGAALSQGGNLLQTVRFPPLTGSNWEATGMWASTEHRGSPGPEDKLEYLDLRSFSTTPPIMMHQAIRALELPGVPNANGRVLVLGCPGGKVRVVYPGRMASISPQQDHHVGQIVAASVSDLGYGEAHSPSRSRRTATCASGSARILQLDPNRQPQCPRRLPERALCCGELRHLEIHATGRDVR